MGTQSEQRLGHGVTNPGIRTRHKGRLPGQIESIQILQSKSMRYIVWECRNQTNQAVLDPRGVPSIHTKILGYRGQQYHTQYDRNERHQVGDDTA